VDRRAERVCLPGVERLDRLHVVVTVQQNGRGRRIRGEQFREHDRMAGRLEDLRAVWAEPVEPRKKPVGRAPHVTVVFGIVGYRRDGQKVAKLDENLVPVLTCVL